MPNSRPRDVSRPDAFYIEEAVLRVAGLVRDHEDGLLGTWAIARLAGELRVPVTIGDQVRDRGGCLNLLGPVGDSPQWSVTVTDPSTGVNVTSDGFVADTMYLLTGVGRAWVELMVTLLAKFPSRKTDVLRAASAVTQEVVDELRRRGLLRNDRRPAVT